MTETTKDTIYNDDNSDLSQGETFEGSGSWTDQLALNKNGRACNTLCNMRLILENDDPVPDGLSDVARSMKWLQANAR